MRRTILLAGVAAGALALTPGTAIGQSIFDPVTTMNNNIDTSITTDVTYTKDVALRGTVRLEGTIEVDSSAVAVLDNKQILDSNRVTFREENFVDGDSGDVDEIFGEDIAVGYFAPIINDTGDTTLTGNDGNVGVNVAAGYSNQQANNVAIASSDFDGGGGGEGNDDDSGGWAEASLTSLQHSLYNFYGPDDTQSDPTGEDTVGNDYRDRNTVGAVLVDGGNGNIGLNVASGAFNQQKNDLAIAVATNASLAEANAAIVQNALFNRTVAMDSQNTIGSVNVTGAAGNIGVNVAAGVGNQQINSLTIAASQGAGNGNGNGNGGGGGEGEGG